MIIAHVGLDGSGKSYGMAQDAMKALKKKYQSKEIWTLNLALKDDRVGRLSSFHQILYLKNSIIFIDEIQRFFPADHSQIDEIAQHIISTHRHDKNVIHWSSQAWEYVNPYIRRETAYAWEYHAIHRDALTGESKWFGTRLKRHRRLLINGVDLECKRRTAVIHRQQKFWIRKKGWDIYDSYEKINVVVPKKITDEYVASIKDPYQKSSTEEVIYHHSEPENQDRGFDENEEGNTYSEGIPREDEPNDSQAVRYVPCPVEDETG